MAEFQRQGRPFTDAHMTFVNEAVRVQTACNQPFAVEGWFPRLYAAPLQSAVFDPTIADVHTQPTDRAGNEVGRVLHVATAQPRLMVISVMTCTGVRAYAGLVSSYHEQITEDFERLTDRDWSRSLWQTRPPRRPVDVRPRQVTARTSFLPRASPVYGAEQGSAAVRS